MTAAQQKTSLEYFFIVFFVVFFFRENKTLIFHVNPLTEDSHETLSLIFFKR